MAPLGDAPFSSPYNTNTHLYDLDTKENQYEDYSAKSRRESGNTAISSIPPSLADDTPHSIHRKHRPPFRSPSSVRALQLSSPEPGSSPRHFNHDLRRQKWSLGAVHNLSVAEDSDNESYSPNGDSEILQHMMAQKRAERSRHVRGASQRTVSEATVDTMQQPPLVLLHISVLPSTMKYSQAALDRLAPQYVLDNLHLLREKLNDIVFARGILVSHPCDEYDVMEERLLEALELIAPRISPCGHFLGDEPDSFLNDDQPIRDLDGDNTLEIATQQHAICNYAHADTVDDRHVSRVEEEDVCDTCAEPMRNPYRGTGHGKKRWEINFYAANGLMRTGAWAAAWREMERVDVEISPWIPDDIKRALQEATQAEEEASAKQRQEEEERVRQMQIELHAATQRAHHLEDDLVRIHEELEATKAATIAPPQPQPPSTPEVVQQQSRNVPTPLTEAQRLELPKIPTAYNTTGDIPLSRLLSRYLWLLAQDKRNIVIAAASFVVVLLAIFLAPAIKLSKGSQQATIDTSSSLTTGAAVLSMSSTLSNAASMISTPTKYQISVGNGSMETAAPAHRP
jgi:hypothetical protein